MRGHKTSNHKAMKTYCSNTPRLREALVAVQGAAKARILTVAHIRGVLDEVMNRLGAATAKAIRGTRVTYCRHVYARGRRCYRRRYVTTCVVLVRGTNAWYVESIERIHAPVVGSRVDVDLRIEAPMAAIDQVARHAQATARIFPLASDSSSNALRGA